MNFSKMHALIEMRDGDALTWNHGRWRGWGWISGLRRDEALAARLAGAGVGAEAGEGAAGGGGRRGVRGTGALAVAVPARGFPPDASRLAEKVFCLEVCLRRPPADAVRAVDGERARDMVRSGVSAWHGERQAYITDPRWRAPTWLDAAELARLLGRRNVHPGHAAVLAVLRRLESRGTPARVILWLGPE